MNSSDVGIFPSEINIFIGAQVVRCNGFTNGYVMDFANSQVYWEIMHGDSSDRFVQGAFLLVAITFLLSFACITYLKY